MTCVYGDVSLTCEPGNLQRCHLQSESTATGDKLIVLCPTKATVRHVIWRENRNTQKIPTGLFREFPSVVYATIMVGLNEVRETDFVDGDKLTDIDLSKNEIRRIPINVFTKTPRLDTLTLTVNRIAEIDDNAFNGLNKLTELDLDSNFLTLVKRQTFAGMPKMEKLTLRSNEIASIEAGALDTLPRLKELDLGINLLTSLPENLFASTPLLSHVDLTANKFKTLPLALTKPNVAIDELILDYNDIRDFKMSDILPMRNLEYLSVEAVGVKATDLRAISGIKSKLNNIDLTENEISDSDILSYLSFFDSLEVIVLNRNHLTKLNRLDEVKDLFPNVTKISLETNPIECNWLETVLPVVKAYEVDVPTGDFDEKIPVNVQKRNVDGQLCGDELQ